MPELANCNHQIAYNDGPKGQSLGKRTPVGQFGHANAFGLSDIHGNVYEWCADDWHSNYDETSPVDGSVWLKTSETTAMKVIRGGSSGYNPQICRSASRYYSNARDSYNYIGFRVVYIPPRILP